MHKKIDVVIVTYNRLELLKKCVKAILMQTYPVENIFVIDNNSSDNTLLFLNKKAKENTKIVPVHLTQNIGGAGGFYTGLKCFIEKSKSDFVWIMDDDTIPTVNALEKLISKTSIIQNFGFLSSNVKWQDGSPAVMNIPEPNLKWNELADKGLIRVNYASFVAILFSRKVILEQGLPIKDFFIWGDDVEYTKRITNSEKKGYMVIDSLVEHKIKQNIATDIIAEQDVNRIKRYYYARRNTIYTMKHRYNKKEYFKWLVTSLIFEPFKILKFSKDKKLLRLKVSLKGTFAGFFFNPSIYEFRNK
ncbi:MULTISPECIES: glycosyltransferase family 2 protein [Lactobacillus]|uniref:Glycosyltransferase n=1 Tax=Lactobacillus xujianguonis TaxID=2495899 RepID=A0A437SVI1_9LACO|nr:MULTISPECIES: glycosyltransferase family 2 protein [Lactobacillus]RVU70939.1 glycosyltransferase [Lactobacillus xujianguonis]RVU73571.1 glycosyltransferase [Lactobacillus xujianguonis]